MFCSRDIQVFVFLLILWLIKSVTSWWVLVHDTGWIFEYVMLCAIWCYLYNSKNVKNTYELKPATLLKLTLLHGCFSRFLNYTNGTKRATHLIYLLNCNLLIHKTWSTDRYKLGQYFLKSFERFGGLGP